MVTTHGSDSLIGDAIGGSGEGNDGIRDASVTVLADANSAAQRVTIRDPFPRGLFGMVGDGGAGGDDVPSHANNWAQTPTITSATTSDNCATVQIVGTANPNSLVDIYFDTQVTILRQPPVTVDANGQFSYSGVLPDRNAQVFAVSTLNDPSHPGRIGSSSETSALVSITSAEPLLEAVGSIADLSSAPDGTAYPGDTVRFTVTMTNVGAVDITSINGMGLMLPADFAVITGTGVITGAGVGFTASDSGFSGGTLGPGQVARYTLDMRVAADARTGGRVISMDVGGDGIIGIPVVGRSRINSPLVPRQWLPTMMILVANLIQQRRSQTCARFLR